MAIELDDKPGQLVAVSKVIASLGGNITQVRHERNGDSEKVNACILHLTTETKNAEHVDEIREALIAKGFKLL